MTHIEWQSVMTQSGSLMTQIERQSLVTRLSGSLMTQIEWQSDDSD
jgi:hypothetical protein